MIHDWMKIDSWITGEAWVGSRISDHVRYLCEEIGPRWASSDGERRAVEYIRGQMEDMGLSGATLEEFPLRTWEHGDAVGRVDGVDRQIDLLPFLYAPPVDISATLVDVGFGMPHELLSVADQLVGSIAIVGLTLEPFSPPIPLPVRLAAIEKAGAAVAVVVERKSGKRVEYHSATDWRKDLVEGNSGEHPLPTFITSREDGGLLRSMASESRKLSIKMDARHYSSTGINTVAELDGTSYPGEYLVLEAHHDTVPDSPGGNDNASGTAVVMDVARVLARLQAETGVAPGCGIRFITFSAEEQLLQGSEAYAERHYGPEPQPRLGINLDEVSTGHMKGIALQFPHLRSLIQEQLDSMNEDLKCHVLAEFDPSGDIFSFARRGIPVGFPWRWRFVGKHPDSDYHHEPGDTADKVRPRELKVYVAFLARLLLRLSKVSPAEWPENPLKVEDVERGIIDEIGSAPSWFR